MSKLFFLLPSSFLVMASFVGSLRGQEPILGSFAVDPVLLVRDHKQADGLSDIWTEYANFRYRFQNEENRREFLADPQLFCIQLGGECGRMGALSGTGTTEIFTLYRERINLFASEACRNTFQANPQRVLEPLLEDSVISAKQNSSLGQKYLNLMIEWIGGRSRIDKAILHIERARVVEGNGLPIQSVSATVFAKGPNYRTDRTWGNKRWSKVLTPDDAFFADPETGVRSMQGSQRIATNRRLQEEILGTMQGVLEEAPAVGYVPEWSDDKRVLLNLYSGTMNHTFELNRDSGEILSHSFQGWGPKMFIGKIRRDFSRWCSISGLRVPMAWDLYFNGEFVGRKDRSTSEYVVRILDEIPIDTFVRPGA